MMPQRINLAANTFPGYSPLESQTFICCGVLGQAHTPYPVFLPAKFKGKSQRRLSRKSVAICCAGSSGSRRNSDISRAPRGYPRNRYLQNDDRDNEENIDESDILNPKLGPLFSFPNTPKSQNNGDPGPREKEIVELFRKVQAKLREKAAASKEEKIEDSLEAKDQAKDRTVESLLKLLRKHSSEDGNEKTGSLKTSSEQKKRHIPNEDKNMKGNSSVFSNVSSATRPPSVFRRRSPIPQVKFQPVMHNETPVNSSEEKQLSDDDLKGNNQPVFGEKFGTELEFDDDDDDDDDNDDDDVDNDDDDDGFTELLEDVGADEMNESAKQQLSKHNDLSAMKVTDLRSLAKSRGVKGFSKMKKVDLVELLCENNT